MSTTEVSSTTSRSSGNGSAERYVSGRAKLDALRPGESLELGDVLQTESGFAAMMQPDGNLVIYRRWPNSPEPVWSSGTDQFDVGARPVKAVMGRNGDFTLQSAGGVAGLLWASGTDGNEGAELTLRDDGTLAVIGASGQPLWSSGHTVSRMVQAAAREAATAPMSKSTGWANVGYKKSMNTSATLYTNGLLAVVVDLKNGDWWTGLRGEIVVVGVDAAGSAVWVTNPEISCPTCCAVPDPSCASSRHWVAPTQQWPADVAGIIVDLDIYQGDAPSFRDVIGETLGAICKYGRGLPGTVGQTIDSMCKAQGK